MPKPQSPHPKHLLAWPWVSLLVTVAAVILLARHMPAGSALSMDSLYYLSTANNLLDGNGISLNNYDLGSYSLNGPSFNATTLWPPLYPVVLSVIVVLCNAAGIADTMGIALFNILSVIVSLFLLTRMTGVAGLQWAGVLIILAFVMSPSLQIVFMYAWSEVLFIPLTLAACFYLQAYCLNYRDDGSRATLFLVLLFVGLATYTRYVGLAYFAAVMLAVFYCESGKIAKRLRTVFFSTTAYLLMIAPLLIRNFVASGSLSGGDRGDPNTNIISDSSLLLWNLYLEFIHVPVILGGALAVITLVLVAWLLFRKPDKIHRANQASSFYKTGFPNVVVPFLFVICYLVFLLISRNRQTIDLDSRMLSVIVPFFLVGFAGLYQQLAKRVRSYLAVLPFLLPVGLYASNGLSAHNSIMNGWRSSGEPGSILGSVYPSITGHKLDPLRRIQEYFKPGLGDLVVTDISRPVIVERLLAGTHVVQILGVPEKLKRVNSVLPAVSTNAVPDNLPEAIPETLLKVLMQNKGLAIISTPAWMSALETRLNDSDQLYQIKDNNGHLVYAVIKLPIEGL